MSEEKKEPRIFKIIRTEETQHIFDQNAKLDDVIKRLKVVSQQEKVLDSERDAAKNKFWLDAETYLGTLEEGLDLKFIREESNEDVITIQEADEESKESRMKAAFLKAILS